MTGVDLKYAANTTKKFSFDTCHWNNLLRLTKLHRPTASVFMETGRPATTTNESDVTTADKDKTLQFDDDTLKGEKKHTIDFTLIISR